MANIIFPNDLNNAPLCTVCLHKVVDDATRSITKLICGHHFHADCIAVEFNFMGLMKCPNCEVIEEDGLWMKVANSEDGESSDEDEDEESNDDDQYNEQHDMNPLHTTNDAQYGGDSHMRWRQQLHVPPPPIALKMIDRRIFVSGLNVVTDPVSHESPTLYEQTRSNVLPCLELTLATTSSSVCDGVHRHLVNVLVVVHLQARCIDEKYINFVMFD
ncbi:hypothetical protein H5410_029161 [Solanum commersonii]|uniref:RING-type domain-containing protein n=1 Tax=Solanum commersonii TaxID=4109 RepID=A0A9J5Z610_SOLCO|nr:hypothetical protein H5410_029161 [Solanum commersonii]